MFHLNSFSFQLCIFLSYAYCFLCGFLSIDLKFLLLNFVLSFPVYFAALGKTQSDCLICEPLLSLFNFCLAGTLDYHQGAKAYQLASLQFILHRTVQYRDPQCLILDGTSLLIISTAEPQGENKGSAQRATVALNHTAARKST